MNEADRPHRILVSYHYCKNWDLSDLLRRFVRRPAIFMDSGAFSAMSQGTRISCDAYADFLLANRQHLTVYASLDVIGNPHATRYNFDRLCARGLSPMPVFHLGSPWSYLEGYMREHPYVALGGMVKKPERAVMTWAIECFRLRERLGLATRFHGFGLTKMKAIQGLPWYSVDSSSWGRLYRWGIVNLYDPIGRRWHLCTLGDTAKLFRWAPIVRRYGSEPDRLAVKAKYDRGHVTGFSARMWRQVERDLRRRHGPIEPPDGDLPGLHLYLADSAIMSHISANAALFGDADQLAQLGLAPWTER